METLQNTIRNVLGSPQFYDSQGVLNYGFVVEYIICGVLLLLVVSSVFRIVRCLFK